MQFAEAWTKKYRGIKRSQTKRLAWATSLMLPWGSLLTTHRAGSAFLSRDNETRWMLGPPQSYPRDVDIPQNSQLQRYRALVSFSSLYHSNGLISGAGSEFVLMLWQTTDLSFCLLS